MSDELTQALQSLFVVALVAALAPLIVGIMPRLRVPQVVVLIVSGVIVGPQVLYLAEPASIVGAGVLSVLVFPGIAVAIDRRIIASRSALTN
jgi:Kef-type K+ transport system membrane component KefB